MMSRANHAHIIVKTEDEVDSDWRTRTYKTSLCGERSAWIYEATNYRKEKYVRITCPECAKLYWADKCKAMPIPLTLEKIPQPSKGASFDERYRWGGSRSVWKILRDGKHIGYVYLLNGFGKGWQACGHSLRRGFVEDDVFRATVDDLEFGGAIGDHNFTSRDQAVFELSEYLSENPDLAKQYGLLPADEYVKRAQQARLDYKREEAERIVRRAEREKERADEKRKAYAAREEGIAQLRDLHARPDLTNFQRAGLAWALAELRIDFG